MSQDTGLSPSSPTSSRGQPNYYSFCKKTIREIRPDTKETSTRWLLELFYHHLCSMAAGETMVSGHRPNKSQQVAVLGSLDLVFSPPNSLTLRLSSLPTRDKDLSHSSQHSQCSRELQPVLSMRLKVDTRVISSRFLNPYLVNDSCTLWQVGYLPTKWGAQVCTRGGSRVRVWTAPWRCK